MVQKRKHHHHRIPIQILLIPGLMLMVSLLLFVFGKTELSYLIMGMAIVVAILVHKEDE